MNYSGFLNFMSNIIEWVARFAVINVLWLLTNIPLLWILFINLNQATEINYLLVIPIFILFPVMTYPSLLAVFSSIRDIIMDKQQPSYIKNYWLAFKKNYKKGLQNGLFLATLWGIWLIDYIYIKNINDFLSIMMIIIGSILFIYSVNIINVQIHYIANTATLFKNALIFTFGKPLLSLFILTSNLFIIYISITQIRFLIPFFTISICAFISFYGFYRMTLNLPSQTDE